MYNILLGMQFICITLIIIEIFFIYFKRVSKEQILFLFALVGLLLNTVAYTYEMMSNSMELALIATKLSYTGKVYMLPLFMLFTFRYCKVYISKFLEIIILIWPLGILGFIYTAEKHSLYYTNISYSYEGIFPHLVTNPGIVFYLYMLNVLMYYIPIIMVLYKRHKHVKEIHEKKVISYFAASLSIPAVTLSIYVTGVTDGYDITALSYAISAGILLILISKYNMLDTISVAKEAIIDNIKMGAIILDENGVIYANKHSTDLIKAFNTRKEKLILEWIRENKIIVQDKAAYEIIAEDFNEYPIKGLVGLTAHDITERYFYEKNLEQAVIEKTKEIKYIEKEFLFSLANVIEERDESTKYHIKRTSRIVELILEALKEMKLYEEVLTESYSENLIEAAMIHDIGKLKVSDLILNKPGKFTEEEFQKIKIHTTEGSKIIENILCKMDRNEYLKVAKEVALYHHEKWNGKGYPMGLKEEEIPLSARIMSVADVYDALISKRIYKEAYAVEKAVDMIKKEACISFDPMIVEAFLKIVYRINVDSKE